MPSLVSACSGIKPHFHHRSVCQVKVRQARTAKGGGLADPTWYRLIRLRLLRWQNWSIKIKIERIQSAVRLKWRHIFPQRLKQAMKAAEFFQFWRGSSMCMFELFQQMRTNTDDGHVHKLELGGSSCPFSQTSVVAMQCVLWKGQVWDSERIFQCLACFQCTLLLYYSSIFQLRASDISSRGCRNSFHSSGKGKPREATIQCGRRTGWTGCSILRLLHEKLVLNDYRSLMIVDHCYSLLVSYSPLWLRYFVQEKESNHMVQIFALQVPPSMNLLPQWMPQLSVAPKSFCKADLVHYAKCPNQRNVWQPCMGQSLIQ